MVKVLLTGGSGFIAAHIIKVLVERNHKVVFTVRSEDKGKKIINAYLHLHLAPDTLSYVIVPDIAADGAFDQAVVSSPPFDAVIHSASPFFFGHDDPVKDILDPAINGTTSILKAIHAHAPSVTRVAITSSFAALVNPSNHPKVYDESSWNPITQEEALEPASTYRASKTFAERAAWDFIDSNKPNFSLSTLNPPLVFGPVLPESFKSFADLNTSNERVRDLVIGKYQSGGLSATGIYLWTDVRDLALAHVRAIEVPEAAGKRFFVTAGLYSNKQIVDAIRDGVPELADKLPAEGSVKDDIPQDVYGFDNSRTRDVLGVTFRELKETVVDTVKSLQHLGL